MMVTFRPNGLCTTEGTILDHSVHDEFRWDLLRESGDQVTVRLTAPSKPPADSKYTFVSEDIVHMEAELAPDKSMDMWFRRVK